MEPSLGMNKIALGLFLVGAAVGAIGWGLFLRMALEFNKVLPPNKRIPLIEYRMHIAEIRRRHEELFPDSALSTAWFALMVVAGAFWASALVLELVRTSR